MLLASSNRPQHETLHTI